jgi:hypothetical protein
MKGHAFISFWMDVERPLAQTWVLNTPVCGKYLTAFLAIWLSAYPSTASVQVPAASDGYIGEPQIPGVRVLVINAARVDDQTLTVALDRAALIFQGAGIRLTWLRCPAGSAHVANFPECRLDGLSPLVLRILPHPASGSASRNALGFAVVTQGDSVYATVFHDPLLSIAGGRRWSQAVLLGHAIAHELGHVLLGTSEHSRYGLMAGQWRDTDLDRAALGLLQFSTAEAARMRAEALRRDHEGNVARAAEQRELP